MLPRRCININRIKLLVYFIGILVSFVYGIITAEYKIYPYKEICEIKRLIFNDSNVKASNSHKKMSRNYYRLNKKSFLKNMLEK